MPRGYDGSCGIGICHSFAAALYCARGIEKSAQEEKIMAKKVLVITSSMRRGGNSETLADEFARGAAEAGNSVEKIALADYELKFCKGCLACQKTGKCVIKDGTEQILAKMNEADVIAFATPIYYYEMFRRYELERFHPSPNRPAAGGKYPHFRPCPLRSSG